MSIIPPNGPMSKRYFQYNQFDPKTEIVEIKLEIKYMGKVYALKDNFPVESYRQSAIDHDYRNMEKHMIQMLRNLVTGGAKPIHPNHPELEAVGRKLIQGGK